MRGDRRSDLPNCTLCRHRGEPCAPSIALLKRLKTALAVAGPATGPDFALTGLTEVACDGAQCSLAFLLSKPKIYVFGDVDDVEAVEELAAFADAFLETDAAETESGPVLTGGYPTNPAAISVARPASPRASTPRALHTGRD